MIRFFKLFINLLYGTFTMGIIAIIVWGSNWVVNIGGESYDVPNLVSNLDDDTGKTIYFSDIIDFNTVSIMNAHKSHEIFLGNEKTGEEYILWRVIPVGWFNKSVTWVKNVVVATLSPSYEIEQMDNYRYAYFVTQHPTIPNMYIAIDSSEINVTNYKEETYDIYGIVYGNKLDPIHIGDSFTKQEVMSDGSWWIFKDTPLADFNFENEVIKFDKYNGEDYDRFEKFLDNKPVAKWAFSEIIIIFALTFFVVYQNPIDFTRNERGVTEINRGFLPRLPMPRRRERYYREDRDERRSRRSRRYE